MSEISRRGIIGAIICAPIMGPAINLMPAPKVYEWQRVASIPESIIGPWKTSVVYRFYDSPCKLIGAHYDR